MARVSILLIAVVLIAGMVGCDRDATPPYAPEIRDWHDLHAMRYHLDKSFRIMNDLNATTLGYDELASETANEGKGWQPIGTSDDRFTGSLDGQGYEISDMFINRPDESFVGLFGAVDKEGVIQDVGVVNATVTGEWAVGGLLGGNWGTVSNSYSSGSVNGADYVGGLMGGNAGSVSNSFSTAGVTGHWDVGGLVGANDSWGTVSNSYATTGSVTGMWAVGGLLGSNWGGSVSKSYSTGTVSGDWHVGGLVGYNQGTVSKSYSTGSVTGGVWVGGLVGNNPGGTVSNSFWDRETSGMEEGDGGIGSTTMEMQDIVTFTGAAWDITAVAVNQANDTHVWNIVDRQTYPFLSWELV